MIIISKILSKHGANEERIKQGDSVWENGRVFCIQIIKIKREREREREREEEKRGWIDKLVRTWTRRLYLII